MTPPNRSLQEKSSARLAAAQLLYKIAVTGERLNPERLAADYREYAEEGDLKEARMPSVPANPAYLRKLLDGIAQHGEALEPWVDKALTGSWRKERMSPLLLALLRLAVFELAHMRNLAPAIVINEYTTLAGRFFGEEETGFVNAALNAVARELRN